jgi:Na+/H+ antiporter NhaC
MAILFPLVIPLAISMGGVVDPGAGAPYSLLLGSIAGVMAGAIFGDHCSPISDTTVLSSTASACDHVDHVRTQLPYALAVALIGVLLGTIPVGMGVSPWICLMAGGAALVLVVRYLGRPSEMAG